MRKWCAMNSSKKTRKQAEEVKATATQSEQTSSRATGEFSVSREALVSRWITVAKAVSAQEAHRK